MSSAHEDLLASHDRMRRAQRAREDAYPDAELPLPPGDVPVLTAGQEAADLETQAAWDAYLVARAGYYGR